MMKKSRLIAMISSLGVMALAVVLMSGDHNDSPTISGTTPDIADLYACQPSDPKGLVLVMNMEGVIPAGRATEEASLEENELMEFNIDVNNDLKEDVLIQAIKRGGSMYFFGPFLTSQTGLMSEINTDADLKNSVKISTVEEVFVAEADGMKFFAGPREDPFFFDRNRFDEYLRGNAPGGFSTPGTDTYAGSNVLSLVVELPKSLLGTPATDVNPFALETPTYNMWVETKKRLP